MTIRMLTGIMMTMAAVVAPTANAQPQAVADYRRVAAQPQVEQPGGRWWESLGDHVLDSLMSVGVEANLDVTMAARRIVLAQNAVKTAQSAYFPTLSLSAGWQANRQSGMTTDVDTRGITTNVWNAGATMSWEIDIFGRVAAQSRQARSQLQASRAQAQAVMLEVEAQIANAYIQVRLAQASLAVAQAQAASQLKVLDITQTRMDVGLVSLLDVEQAQTVYNSTLASIPLAEASIRTSASALAVLLDCTTDQVLAAMGALAPIPDYRQMVPANLTLDNLRQRPDMIEAEAEVQTQLDALGIARKDYLPTFSIQGAIGTAAHSASDLFKSHSLTYTLAPTLSWTAFDGMRRKYGVADAREQVELSIDNYNLSLLNAVQEAETALTNYRASLKYIDAIATTLDHSEHALSLALDRYKQGLAAMTTVVDAQISVLNYHNTLLQAKARALTDLIDLYKAMGGALN